MAAPCRLKRIGRKRKKKKDLIHHYLYAHPSDFRVHATYALGRTAEARGRRAPLAAHLRG